MPTAWSPALYSNGCGSGTGVALRLGMTPDLGLRWETPVTWGDDGGGRYRPQPCPGSAPLQPSRLRPILRPQGRASVPRGYSPPGLWAGTVCTSHSLAAQEGVSTSQGGLACTQTTHPQKHGSEWDSPAGGEEQGIPSWLHPVRSGTSCGLRALEFSGWGALPGNTPRAAPG